MATVNLLFRGPPTSQPLDLVFGSDVGGVISDATITGGDLDLPVLAFEAAVVLGIPVQAELGELDDPAFESEIVYFSDTQRPLVGQAVVRWQDTEPQLEVTSQRWQDSAKLPAQLAARYQDATGIETRAVFRFQDADRGARFDPRVRYQDGSRRHGGALSSFQDGRRTPNDQRVRYQEGNRIQAGAVLRFQDGVRNPAAIHWVAYQEARALSAYVMTRASSGRALERGWSTRYQDAWAPRPGESDHTPVVPPVDPCYLPSGDLVFVTPWSADGNLLFVCERHTPPVEPPGETVVIPVRRIYTVINSATLTRVDTGATIPAVGMTLAIDVDSWTWSFTAHMPGAALPLLARGPDRAPVEVQASINGVAYRALILDVSRDRMFARADLTVSGRGKATVLDAPYSPLMTFGNPSAARTVKQLVNDVLTSNGVSLGWNVDDAWEPDDWLVPAGVFSHQGSYISAINAIAAAAGAYVQPHATAKALRVLRRYPVAPWEWSGVTPDYELPAAVVSKEGVTWLDKAIYNRVFVRGMKAGIVGQATRIGTDGGLEAPMVTDPLITDAIGARQRALPVLADVGEQEIVTLRLPVLAETGIITPGKFVRYVDDGFARIGLVRSTSAEVQRAEKKLTIWQTIGVETHVNV